MSEDKQDEVFKLIQKFLKNPPVIVWGSGATIPFNMPSMWHLNELLKKEIDEFDNSSNNLEIELGKDIYDEQMPAIRKLIWQEIDEKDNAALQLLLEGDRHEFKGIKTLLEKFKEVHPKVVNIITTNYDRVLENVMGFYDIHFTDGFLGKNLSLFNEENFKKESIINLVKVHGSLNWFEKDGDFRFLTSSPLIGSPLIICPGKKKFQEAYNSPYRELIQQSDKLIKEASSFLVIGFGFNDEHLTPRIRTSIKKGTPIVVITKCVTDSCKEELKDSEKYILIEESESENTKFTIKTHNKAPYEFVVKGNYWSLNNFIEII
jgi:hypothetical protein